MVDKLIKIHIRGTKLMKHSKSYTYQFNIMSTLTFKQIYIYIYLMRFDALFYILFQKRRPTHVLAYVKEVQNLSCMDHFSMTGILISSSSIPIKAPRYIFTLNLSHVS